MAECSCIIHFQYSRKYCNGCNFFATECVMLCPTLTKLLLEYSLFSCHKLTKYDFGVQFGTKRSQVQILSPRPKKWPEILGFPAFSYAICTKTCLWYLSLATILQPFKMYQRPQVSICCGFAIFNHYILHFLQVTFWLRNK